MAVFKAINVKAGKNANLSGIINYVLNPKKTEQSLVTGICCDVPKALEMFQETKKFFGKQKGRQYYHFVQSFHPNEKISPKEVHAMAVEFAEKCRKFWGFEIIIATHAKGTQHLHSHIIVNSVNFLNGKKFHITRKELALMKELQNQICIEHGYSPAPEKGFDMYGNKRKTVTAYDAKTYRNLKKAESNNKKSYLMNCSKAFTNSMKIAKTKEQFIKLMHAQGFSVEWKDNKKHITFTDEKLKASGERKCKVRLKKLAQYFPELKEYKTKEDLENGIIRNRESIRGTKLQKINSRTSIAGINQKHPETGGNAGIIDLNSKYEQFLASFDREPTVYATEEDARLCRELAETEHREPKGITEQNDYGKGDRHAEVKRKLRGDRTNQEISF